ncbi:hypothetical protein HPSSW114_0860 [Glaesserella parasuis SW114]|nr:hypothetical protein HPSSW114_0860 [Glaesserella parasuis SW114]
MLLLDVLANNRNGRITAAGSRSAELNSSADLLVLCLIGR